MRETCDCYRKIRGFSLLRIATAQLNNGDMVAALRNIALGVNITLVSSDYSKQELRRILQRHPNSPGSIPRSFRIRRTVDRETVWPNFASSPTIRV